MQGHQRKGCLDDARPSYSSVLWAAQKVSTGNCMILSPSSSSSNHVSARRTDRRRSLTLDALLTTTRNVTQDRKDYPTVRRANRGMSHKDRDGLNAGNAGRRHTSSHFRQPSISSRGKICRTGEEFLGGGAREMGLGRSHCFENVSD